MDRIDPTKLAEARERIASTDVSQDPTPAQKDGVDMAKIHSRQFVDIVKDEYKGDPEAMIQFTMSYFENLKKLIDAGIQAM